MMLAPSTIRPAVRLRHTTIVFCYSNEYLVLVFSNHLLCYILSLCAVKWQSYSIMLSTVEMGEMGVETGIHVYMCNDVTLF